MKPDGSASEFEVAPESGEHNEYTEFARDMIEAYKKGSVMELAKCLKAFHEMIKDEDEAQDSGA